MKQGKFEAARKKPKPPKVPETPAEQKAASEAEVTAAAPGAEPRRRRDWLLIAVPIIVVLAVAAIVLLCLRQNQAERSAPVGMTKEETLEHFRQLAETLEQSDMVLTLKPDDPAGGEPYVFTLTPAQSMVRVDLAGLEADLEEGVGKVARGRYDADPAAYISLDRAALRSLVKQAAEACNQPFLESFSGVVGTGGQQEQKMLVLNPGQRGRAISEEAIYFSLLSAYCRGSLAPRLNYQTRLPKALDAEELWLRYCTAPTDAVMNSKTFEITPEVLGYGVPRQQLTEALARLEEGKALVLPMGELLPEVTAQALEEALYADVLGEAHTPHSWVDDRTHNLMLACEAINGKVVMPGEIFSFNEAVGERTAAKGYREATAYVSGASVPEIGGGVCQVASSIYYAVLQADLYTVERHAHTYLVTYVPKGMDAAIYWGALDYKFENSSPYPIKIEADVSDGEVHVILRGTEWKDYTVKLSWKQLEEVPYETKTRVVTDGSYKDGDVIVSPYTGYTITTYKTLIDRDDNPIETVKIKTSVYSKRDRVVAVVPKNKPEPQPTETP